MGMLIDLLLLYLSAPVQFLSNPLEVIVPYSWVARDVILFKKTRTKERPKLLSSSGMSRLLTNFQLNNLRILNFRVMALRDITL